MLEAGLSGCSTQMSTNTILRVVVGMVPTNSIEKIAKRGVKRASNRYECLGTTLFLWQSSKILDIIAHFVIYRRPPEAVRSQDDGCLLVPIASVVMVLSVSRTLHLLLEDQSKLSRNRRNGPSF